MTSDRVLRYEVVCPPEDDTFLSNDAHGLRTTSTAPVSMSSGYPLSGVHNSAVNAAEARTRLNMTTRRRTLSAFQCPIEGGLALVHPNGSPRIHGGKRTQTRAQTHICLAGEAHDASDRALRRTSRGFGQEPGTRGPRIVPFGGTRQGMGYLRLTMSVSREYAMESVARVM
ncbi:hypothetical protein C8Q79DRAFT_193739 [Trametes meyenii]|nr:hypothetical protein C8Q79DRAFT_193739 [Trametes meyenii]